MERNRANVRLQGFCHEEEVLKVANWAVANTPMPDSEHPILNLVDITEMGWNQYLVADTGLFVVHAITRIELTDTTQALTVIEDGTKTATSTTSQSAKLTIAGTLRLSNLSNYAIRAGTPSDPEVSKLLTISPSRKHPGGYKFQSDSPK